MAASGRTRAALYLYPAIGTALDQAVLADPATTDESLLLPAKPSTPQRR
ncbi:hypothetical protein [Kitasatospora sp. NPDC093102]